MTQHRGRGLVRFLPALSVPNPLHWLPRIRLSRRSRKKVITATRTGAPSDRFPATLLPPPPTSKVPLRPSTDVFAGGLARACSQATIHPLDTLKVQLQTRLGGLAASASASGSSTSTLTSSSAPLTLMQAAKGLGSMYRGVFGAASGAGIAIGAYFAFYGTACNVLSTHTDLSPSAIAFSAGGIAAAGGSLVKVPLAVCIRSVQAGIYPNVINAAQSIVATAGPRGLFTGYLPTLMEDVPDMAIKFAGYETLRILHSNATGGRASTKQEDFVMGAVSGALAAAVTTPLDVIKTNMMCMAASRPTVTSAVTRLMAQGGPKVFFKGVGLRAASNGINSAVFFCFFEAFRTAIKEQSVARARELVVLPLSLDSGSEEA